jgi:hypothetical protein
MGKKKATGRPSSYNSDLAADICVWIAEGKSLREFCRKEGNPSQSMIFRWLQENEVFREQYCRARQDQADTFVDEIMEIADDATNDYMMRLSKDGETVAKVVDQDHIARSRLRIDARKWAAAKQAPRKYSDKVVTEHTGKDGGPIQTEEIDLSEAERARRIAFILQRGLAPEEASQ